MANFPKAKTITNLILLIALFGALIVLLLNLVNLNLPVLRCKSGEIHEPSISHPFMGDTVTNVILICVTIIAPFIQMFVTEWFSIKTLKDCVLSAIKVYRNYVYGLLVVMMLNDIAKSTLNAPRPHWLQTCKPSFNPFECNDGWLYEYECTNTEISRIQLTDARKSFPSGHAALSYYAAFFMAIYQHQRLNIKKTGVVLLLWLHIIWIGFAIFCGLSRVIDKRHHPIDVFFGGLLGSLGAILTALLLCNGFKRVTQQSKTREKQSAENEIIA